MKTIIQFVKLIFRNRKDLLTAILLLCISSVFSQEPPRRTFSLTTNLKKATEINADTILEFSIAAVGDLMCHSTQFNYARVQNDLTLDSFDFRPNFEVVLPWLEKPDLLIGNLETTLAGERLPYDGYPKFNTPDNFALSLKQSGFDFIVTANNHTLDTDTAGLLRTIHTLDTYKIPHTGSFRSKADRDSLRIIRLGLADIAILNYTYGTNDLELPHGHEYMINYLDSNLIINDIQKARKKNADLVLVFYHFGLEYEREPNEEQKKWVQLALDQGADIILGAHPHTLQKVSFFRKEKGKLDSALVAWSLGNFISNQYQPFTQDGIILNIHFKQYLVSGKIRIDRVDYLPTWVYRGDNEEHKIHTIYPAEYGYMDSLDVHLEADNRIKMQDSYMNTNEIIGQSESEVHPLRIIEKKTKALELDNERSLEPVRAIDEN